MRRNYSKAEYAPDIRRGAGAAIGDRRAAQGRAGGRRAGTAASSPARSRPWSTKSRARRGDRPRASSQSAEPILRGGRAMDQIAFVFCRAGRAVSRHGPLPLMSAMPPPARAVFAPAGCRSAPARSDAVLFCQASMEALARTDITQPCMFAVELAGGRRAARGRSPGRRAPPASPLASWPR